MARVIFKSRLTILVVNLLMYSMVVSAQQDPENCQQLNCTHRCIAANASIPTTGCACFSGYELDEDGRTCNDINECSRNTSLCDNQRNDVSCVNTEGSYACTTCQDGSSDRFAQYYQRRECCQKNNTTQCGKSFLFGGMPSANASRNARVQNWPWMAGIFTRTTLDEYRCGGTLISNNYVVTSARCVSNLEVTNQSSSVLIALGVVDINDKTNNRAQYFSAATITIHPNYTSSSTQNDIALILLNESATITSFVSPICLPNGETPSEDKICYNTEFSNLGILQQNSITILPISVCQESFSNATNQIIPLQLDNQICAGNSTRDHTANKSNSAVSMVCQRCKSCDWYLAGITSVSETGNLAGLSGVYANAAHLEDWISEVTGQQIESIQNCVGSYWSQWETWTQCTASCDGGLRSRFRMCVNGNAGDPGCLGNGDELVTCASRACGSIEWSSWNTWFRCIITCGSVVQARYRDCLNGLEDNRGCSGQPTQFRPCTIPSTCGDCQQLNCSQRCVSTEGSNSSVSCACVTGFELGEDGRTCHDINECERNPNICDNGEDGAACVNTVGSYACTTCQDGTSNNTAQYYQRNECCRKSKTGQCGKSPLDGGTRSDVSTETKIQFWPWMVFIQTTTVAESQLTCVGTLISNNYVITSATCLDIPEVLNRSSSVLLILGSDDLLDKTNTHAQFFSAAQITIHPNFTNYPYDIALIRLNESATFNNFVSSICLPGGESPPENATCYGGGFGRRGVLRQFDLDLIPFSECQQVYRDFRVIILPEFFLCAGTRDGPNAPCTGNHGSPLVCQRCRSCDWYLAGVFTIGRSCFRSGPPGGYANVVQFESWIAEITGENIERSQQCVDPAEAIGTSTETSSPGTTSSQSDSNQLVIILPVLGSILFLCLLIYVVIKIKKTKCLRMEAILQPSKKQRRGSAKSDDSGMYEEVGPALPQRTQLQQTQASANAQISPYIEDEDLVELREDDAGYLKGIENPILLKHQDRYSQLDATQQMTLENDRRSAADQIYGRNSDFLDEHKYIILTAEDSMAKNNKKPSANINKDINNDLQYSENTNVSEEATGSIETTPL